MKLKSLSLKVLYIFIICLLAGAPGAALGAPPQAPSAPLGAAFTYQGFLSRSGQAINNVCDFTFSLWDAQSGGSTIGSPFVATDLPVIDGRFTTALDFGSVFAGSLYWLEIAVQCPTDVSATTLPRQALHPTPNALNADLLDGQHSGAFAAAAHTHPHSSLSGLANDDHPQYFNLSQNETVNGVPAFNGAPAPFNVSASGLVSNLNADSLDGQHGSFYQNASNINAGTLGANYYSAISDLNAEGYLGNAAGDLAQNNGNLQSTLNADLLDGLDSTYFQARVSGACAPGATIQAINADGTVLCEPHEERLGNHRFTLASGNVDGDHNAITIGSDGMPVIAYRMQDPAGTGNYQLWVAHCEDHICSTATLTQIDNIGNTGYYPAIAITIGADDLPIISYYEAINGDLRVAHCNDARCSGAMISLVDAGAMPAHDVGQHSSITIGVDKLPLISYYDTANGNLKVAHCSDPLCLAPATITTVDGAAAALDVGMFTSITIGSDGIGLISYYDVTNFYLKTAYCGNVLCNGPFIINQLDTTALVGMFTSITIASDGFALISYFDITNQALRAAHCVDIPCSPGAPHIISILDGAAPADNVGIHTSISIGSDGLGVITYYDMPNDGLKVAHCDDVACSSAKNIMVDSPGMGRGNSLAIGVDGMPVISYFDSSVAIMGGLRFMHCSNVFCVPFWRRR